MRFRTNPDRFAIDAVEGETIVMDLVDGRLFLLESGAATVWEHVASGVPQDTLETAVEHAFGATVRDDVRRFVTDLIARGLLEATDDGDASAASVRLPAELGPLSITVYDDMTSIITMDPIHDVDPGRGWPFDVPA